MTDWFTSSRHHVLSQPADPPTAWPSSHLEALSWRSAGLSAVHFDPNYMSGSCTFPHRLVFSISNWSKEGADWWEDRERVSLGQIGSHWSAATSARQRRVASCELRTLSDVDDVLQGRETPSENHQRRRSRRSSATVQEMRHQLTVNYRNMTSASPPTTSTGLIEIGQSSYNVISRKTNRAERLLFSVDVGHHRLVRSSYSTTDVHTACLKATWHQHHFWLMALFRKSGIY